MDQDFWFDLTVTCTRLTVLVKAPDILFSSEIGLLIRNFSKYSSYGVILPPDRDIYYAKYYSWGGEGALGKKNKEKRRKKNGGKLHENLPQL